MLVDSVSKRILSSGSLSSKYRRLQKATSVEVFAQSYYQFQFSSGIYFYIDSVATNIIIYYGYKMDITIITLDLLV